MTKEHQVLKNAIHDTCALDLTQEQLEELVRDPRIQASLAVGGVDTVTRETAAEVLSQKILGRSWPTYSEENSDEFFWAFNQAATAQGYKLVD
jgi:hypothetical protein